MAFMPISKCATPMIRSLNHMCFTPFAVAFCTAPHAHHATFTKQSSPDKRQTAQDAMLTVSRSPRHALHLSLTTPCSPHPAHTISFVSR